MNLTERALWGAAGFLPRQGDTHDLTCKKWPKWRIFPQKFCSYELVFFGSFGRFCRIEKRTKRRSHHATFAQFRRTFKKLPCKSKLSAAVTPHAPGGWRLVQKIRIQITFKNSHCGSEICEIFIHLFASKSLSEVTRSLKMPNFGPLGPYKGKWIKNVIFHDFFKVVLGVI